MTEESSQRAREFNEQLDRFVARQCAIPCRFVHPRYAPGTFVRVDKTIRERYSAHPLAGERVRVCHGEEHKYPLVPVELPGQTQLEEDCTRGNVAYIPEEYISEVQG